MPGWPLPALAQYLQVQANPDYSALADRIDYLQAECCANAEDDESPFCKPVAEAEETNPWDWLPWQ